MLRLPARTLDRIRLQARARIKPALAILGGHNIMAPTTPKEVKLIAEQHNLNPEKFLAVIEQWVGYEEDKSVSGAKRDLLAVDLDRVEFKAELLEDGEPCTASEIDYLKALIENGFVEGGFMLHIPESETHLQDDWDGEEVV